MPTSRICFVVEIFHPEDRGGQGRQSFELVRALVAAGHQVRAVTRRHLTSSKKRETLEGIDVRRLPPCGIHKGRGWRSLAPITYFLVALFIELLRTVRQYDVLVVGGVKAILMPTVLVALLFGKRIYVRVDATGEIEHAITPESLARMGLRSSSALIRTWTWLRRRLLLQADGIVALSAGVREVLLSLELPPERILAIPNGIDLARWSPASPAQRDVLRSQLGLPAGPLFAYAGRLSRAKGLPLLLSAWQQFVVGRPDAHLLLIGSGSGSFDDCESELRAMSAQPALRGRVTFTGHVDNAHEYLQASDVFVLCSESEGFGLALVEAMACGLPCISTPVGVAEEIIEPGRNGLLIRIGDREGLQAAFEALLAKRASWPDLGVAARAVVASRFGLEHVVAQYAGLFKALDPTSAPAWTPVRESGAASLPIQQ